MEQTYHECIIHIPYDEGRTYVFGPSAAPENSLAIFNTVTVDLDVTEVDRRFN